VDDAAVSFSLTQRQRDTLRFIQGYQEAHQGVSPTCAIIRDGLGLAGTSKSAAQRLLTQLEARGHIRRLFGRQQAIEVLCPVSIPRAPDGAPLYSVNFHA
jgi:SOS-response transcriptional repressor LexA